MTECARYRWEQKEVHAARTAGASRHSVQGRHVAAGAPVMILIMENAALSAIRPFLDIGESAVGTAINVRHLAATPVGHDVRAEAAACGHLPYLEDPTGFNILVSDFVA